MAHPKSIRHSGIMRKELVPGDAKGTIFENNPLLKVVKEYPTYAAFNDFIKSYGWSEVNQIILPFEDFENWDVIYGLAKTFQTFEIAYHFRVTEEAFSKECFETIPKYIARIIKAGILEAEVKWDRNDNGLNLNTEVWSDFICGFSQKYNECIYFVEGKLDAEGHLKNPLKLVTQKKQQE